jgi:hypothetical protein
VRLEVLEVGKKGKERKSKKPMIQFLKEKI